MIFIKIIVIVVTIVVVRMIRIIFRVSTSSSLTNILFFLLRNLRLDLFINLKEEPSNRVIILGVIRRFIFVADPLAIGMIVEKVLEAAHSP